MKLLWRRILDLRPHRRRELADSIIGGLKQQPPWNAQSTRPLPDSDLLRSDDHEEQRRTWRTIPMQSRPPANEVDHGWTGARLRMSMPLSEPGERATAHAPRLIQDLLVVRAIPEEASPGPAVLRTRSRDIVNHDIFGLSDPPPDEDTPSLGLVFFMLLEVSKLRHRRR